MPVIIIFFGFSIYQINAQSLVRVKLSKFKVPGEEATFREAATHIVKGNILYRRDKEGDYIRAREHYLKAIEYNKDNAALNYMVAACYLKTSEKWLAFSYLEEAFLLDEKVASDINYLRACAMQYSHKFDKAIPIFEEYKESLSGRKLKLQKQNIDKRIKECESGIELMKRPIRCFIDNLGEGVNTNKKEYSPVFYLNDSILYFTSRREKTTGKRKNPQDNLYYEDIYSSRAVDGKWGDAEQFGYPINTRKNDACVDISPEGKEICVYRGKKGHGDLFNSQYRDGKWRAFTKMKKIDKHKYRESSVSLSRDSLTLYFISDRPGGQGGQDIWVSYRTQDGRRWQKPENLSSVVNTPYDEETVEISANGKTLYFSSRGHNTMGGYDVFKTNYNNDGTWSEPENIGYPINTPDDDMFFMLTQDEKYGYYSAIRPEGYGDFDVYEITFLGKERPINQEGEDDLIACIKQPVSESEIEKPVNIKIIQLSLVKGTVTDAYSGEPVEALIELVDNKTGVLVSSVTSYASTGAFTVPLPPGKDYALTAGAADYFFHSENFVIADTSIHEVIRKDIQLQPMGIGAKIVLNNVFFDTGKSTLRPESYSELNRLIDIMHQYPRLKVEISGHTDSKGSDQSNQKLSQDRAQAVVNYLTSQGIDIDLVSAKGYGESEPRADNDTEEGRQLNRRVEAKILDK